MAEFKMEPFGYQMEDAKFILSDKRVGILHEPGVGKTFGVLIAAVYLAEKHNLQTLVVVPPILIEEWIDKANAYFDHSLTLVAYKGSPKERTNFKLAKADIVICSYNILQREGYSNAKGKSIFERMPRLGMLVGDETKFIKNPKSKAFKAFQSIKHRTKYLALMNGTPVVKNPGDIFCIIQLINPNRYVTHKNFMTHHGKYIKNDEGFPLLIGWKRLDDIKAFLDVSCRRLIKKDVLDLPPKQLIVKMFSLEPKHYSVLKRYWETGLIELTENGIDLVGRPLEVIFDQAMSLAMKVRQALFDPSILGLDMESIYFEHLRHQLDELGDEQTIICTHFHNTLSMVKKVIEERGGTYSEIHGQISAVKKEKAKKDFKSGKVQYLLGNPKSMGVGLDFQQCRNMIFFEQDYEVDSFWQGQDRIHRPGQDRDVRYYVFLAKKTIAIDLMKSIMTNADFVKKLLDKQSSSEFFDNSITEDEVAAWQKKMN